MNQIDRKSLKKESKTILRTKRYWRNILIGFVLTLVTAGVLNNSVMNFVIGNTGFSVDNFFSDFLSFITGNEGFLSIKESSPQWQKFLYPLLGLFITIFLQFFTRNYTLVLYLAYTIVGDDFIHVKESSFPLNLLFYIAVAYLLYLSITFFLLKPVGTGAKRYYREKAQGVDADGNNLSYSFHSYYWNIFLTKVLDSLLLSLWSLTILGGIIKHYQYYFVDEILGENPSISPRRVLELSKRLTKKRLGELFRFELSFLGWNLLNSLSGSLVGFFFYHPYQYLCRECFYLKAKEEALKKNPELQEIYEEWDEKNKESFITRTAVDINCSYTLTDYFLIFFIVAIGGWVWEVSLHWMQTFQFTNRGSLWGPWIPIYGFGAVTALFLLKKLRKYPWAIFLVSGVLCCGMEYLTGWILDLNGRVLWNYYGFPVALPTNHNPAYICAYGFLAFAFGCTMATYYIGPLIHNFLSRFSEKSKWIVISVLLIGIVSDSIVSLFIKNPGGIDPSGYESTKELLSGLFKAGYLSVF